MNLNRVTVTGTDDGIRPEELLPLTERYPWVEWGILFSAKRQGAARYPSLDWIRELAGSRKTSCMNLSAHLCGQYVRDVCIGFWPTIYPLQIPLFRRVQFNFAGGSPTFDSVEFQRMLWKRRAYHEFILQADGANNVKLEFARSAKVNAVPLFDRSGGAGTLPDSWPTAIPPYSGYAGGLTPENLAEQLPRIADAAGDVPCWIDVESGVRTADKFDLVKVERFLDTAAKWVTA